MQRLGIQTHTGAAWTATIKDGLAAFAHHGHCRFPHVWSPHGLDGHIDAPLAIREGAHGRNLVWNVSIVDDRIDAKLPG